MRKESTTTPIRIVYDCSCKQSPDAPSLNDCLHPGPPFLNDLCAILLHFRQHSFAFSADIEKAFLHVHLDKVDRDSIHISYGCQITWMNIAHLLPTDFEWFYLVSQVPPLCYPYLSPHQVCLTSVKGSPQ